MKSIIENWDTTLSGAVVGVLATLWATRKQVVEAKRQANAAEAQIAIAIATTEREGLSIYLETMACALEQMANEFENGSIPYSAGNTFKFLTQSFKQKVGDKLPVDGMWNSLQELLKEAKYFDRIYTNQMFPDEKDKITQINNLKRSAGILRGWKGAAS